MKTFEKIFSYLLAPLFNAFVEMLALSILGLYLFLLCTFYLCY